ncbi:MAG: DegT/DnrJ/EryC1/StrS aminotransferase family protein [Phycisphaeraceae bacterium]|nr:DegT/DnrJ/EryC1/StrS aminotransferase family protein [Phycisphaeraceae bacterium]
MTDAIPLSLPDITDDDVQIVVQTLRSGRLSIGPQVEALERLVARRTRRTHAVAVSSGTAGLHTALLALGVGPGDEVITPAFSFIASANCVLHAGARPVFVDCDPGSLNMRLEDVEAAITERTRAVIGVEVFGNPSGMRHLAALCARYEIPLLEDACEGLGGRCGDDPIGAFGRLAVFGFYPNKQITTGEGGMIVTDDDRLASLCRSIRNHGRGANTPTNPMETPASLGSWLEHERLGYNYRLNELSAALGVSQMQRLDELIERRQMVADTYTRRLLGHPDLILPTVEPGTFMSWFVYVVRLSDRFTRVERDEIIEGLRRHEVGAANYFPAIPQQPFYRRVFGYSPGDFPCAESVSHRTIALPFFTRLTAREIDLVCQTLELMIQRTTFRRS